MYCSVRKNVGKLPYEVLITQIVRHKGIHFSEHSFNSSGECGNQERDIEEDDVEDDP